MPIDAGTVTVGTAAVEIPVTCVMPFTLEIKNNDNTDDVFIGPSDVTTSNGLRLAKDERVEIGLSPLDRVYAVSTKSGHTVSYLKFSKAC